MQIECSISTSKPPPPTFSLSDSGLLTSSIQQTPISTKISCLALQFLIEPLALLPMKKSDDKLVWIGYVFLVIYNILALTGVFDHPLSTGFHKFYQDNFGTITFLEFIIVAGLFVNMILNFDSFKKQRGKIHLALTAVCLICFFIKLIFFFMGIFKEM